MHHHTQHHVPLQDEPQGTTVAVWRRGVLTAEPFTAFGQTQLQQLLSMLSSCPQSPLTELQRLFYLSVCSERSVDRPIVSALPQLAGWWASLEGARWLVNARLRSSFGGPAQTFEGLERLLHVRPTRAIRNHAAQLSCSFRV